MRKLLAVVVAVTLAVPLFADELILVPVWYNGRGAEGSNWTTHFSAFNSGNSYTEPNDRGLLPCPWLANPCPRGFFEDKMIVYPAPYSAPGGFLMSVPRGHRMYSCPRRLG